MIVGQQLVGSAGFDDWRAAVLAKEVEPTIGVDGRGGIVASPTLLPQLLGRQYVDTRSNAGVVDHEQQLADEQLRRARRHHLAVLPFNVRFGHITLAVGPHGKHLPTAGASVQNQPTVPIQWPGRDVHPAMIDAPDFSARAGIVGDRGLGAGGDELWPAIDIDDRAGAVSLLNIAVGILINDLTIALPNRFTSELIERHDILQVVTVVGNDEQVLEQDRR